MCGASCSKSKLGCVSAKLQRIPTKLLFQKYTYVANKSYAYQQKFGIYV